MGYIYFAIFVSVVIAIVLHKNGVGDSLIVLILTSFLSMVGGGTSGALVSKLFTPIAGVPLGLLVFALIFVKMLKPSST